MADSAIIGQATRCRSPLAEVDHNIVHASRHANDKIVALKSDRNGKQDFSANIDLNATHLVSSPYPEFANQLRLEGLETSFKLLAFALSILRPVRADYATAPYLMSFNWGEVFALLQSLCKRAGFCWKEMDVYVVIFRSKLLESADRTRLGLLDQKSHEEACASGGLIKYWFGSTDNDRRNLATCLWRHADDASLGGGGPW